MKPILNKNMARALAGALCLSVVTAGSASAVQITPSSLRKNLMENNNDIMSGLSQVWRAKDQVNLSRAQLLPSLNLSAVIGGGGSPTFLLSSVSFLLPFLLPSNWLNLAQSKNLLKAQESSFYVMELNDLASGYAMYATVLGDIELRDAYAKNYQELADIARITKERYDAGLESPDDTAQAASQSALAQVQYDNADRAVKQELAALRQAIGLSMSTSLSVSGANIPSSTSEGGSARTVLARALAKAPENQQLDLLLAATKDARWSTTFSFISSATVNSANTGMGATSFTQPAGGLGLNFTFATLPQLALNSDNVNDILIQKRQIELNLGQTVEATLASISSDKRSVAAAGESLKQANTAYTITMQKYENGLIDLLHVLTIQQEQVTAAVTRVQNQLDMSLQRINLHRALITDQFAQVAPCDVNIPTPSLFQTKHKSLQEVCRPPAATTAALK